MEDTVLQVSEFVDYLNQTLEFAYPTVVIEGEVSGFTISKNKWVFFDLKDSQSTINCFMSVYQLKIPIEDGMKLKVTATPKLTRWGRFSVTVRSLQPSGEGSMKRAQELLKQKLQKEGLFSPDRKRPLPQYPQRVGVIASVQSAGYADFVKILDDRWGGVELLVADVQVQGDVAPAQIVRAVDYFNQMPEPVDAVVMVRGGGSADDLYSFSTEEVTRAVAGSRSPIVVGVGHEVDINLADLAADVRAATPTNAAELLVPDRQELIQRIDYYHRSMPQLLNEAIQRQKSRLRQNISYLAGQLLAPKARIEILEERLRLYNPHTILQKGYSIARSQSGEVVDSVKQVKKGDTLEITLKDGEMKELETIVAWFESAEIDVTEGLKKFEDGSKLAQDLKKQLEEVENTVTKIQKSFEE